jgi:hypothetical protein
MPPVIREGFIAPCWCGDLPYPIHVGIELPNVFVRFVKFWIVLSTLASVPAEVRRGSDRVDDGGMGPQAWYLVRFKN